MTLAIFFLVLVMVLLNIGLYQSCIKAFNRAYAQLENGEFSLKIHFTLIDEAVILLLILFAAVVLYVRDTPALLWGSMIIMFGLMLDAWMRRPHSA